MLAPDTLGMGRGVVLLVVCALLLAGAILTRQREPLVAAPIAAAAVSPAAAQVESEPEAVPGRSVTLVDTRAVLRFPEGYQLAVEPAQLEPAGAQDSCTDAFEYCIYATSPEAAAAAGMSVHVRGDLPTEADCVLEPLPGFEANLPEVGGAGDHATARFGTVASTSADATLTLGLRRLHFDGVCYEFVSRVLTEAPQEPAEARSGLNAIVDGLMLPDGRSGLWAAGR